MAATHNVMSVYNSPVGNGASGLKTDASAAFRNRRRNGSVPNYSSELPANRYGAAINGRAVVAIPSPCDAKTSQLPVPEESQAASSQRLPIESHAAAVKAV